MLQGRDNPLPIVSGRLAVRTLGRLVPTACQFPHSAAAQPRARLGQSRRYSLPMSSTRVSRQSGDEIRRWNSKHRAEHDRVTDDAGHGGVCHAICSIGSAAAARCQAHWPFSPMAGRARSTGCWFAGPRLHSRRSLQPEKVDGGDVLRRHYCSAVYATNTQEPLLTAYRDRAGLTGCDL